MHHQALITGCDISRSAATMTIPTPGVGDIIELATLLRDWLQRRNRQAAFKAWRETLFEDVCDVLTNYYEARGLPLFSYPHPSGKRLRVPLYVRPDWTELTNRRLEMYYAPVMRYYQPSRPQQDFLEFYHELRKELGDEPIWNGKILRLIKLQSFPNKLILEFEEGRFFDSIMCHYLLEHELIACLAKGATPRHIHLDLRDEVASNVEVIEGFCQNNVSRVGVSNLILLRRDEDTFIAVVQRRGPQSLAQGFDTVSSGVFDITTAPRADFELRHKVLKEVYEELFGNPEVAVETRKMNPRFFYEEDGISDLLELIDNSLAIFQVTGFCIDLVRIIPEITTVLVVRDASYYHRHFKGEGRRFNLNLEYRLSSLLHIDRLIEDVDEYLANEIVTDPNCSRPSYGLDPMRWTLPGGFCFYQGLKRAVTGGLL
jgi:hypothetical protein